MSVAKKKTQRFSFLLRPRVALCFLRHRAGKVAYRFVHTFVEKARKKAVADNSAAANSHFIWQGEGVSTCCCPSGGGGEERCFCCLPRR